jgi:hypothetical protein
MYGEISWTNGWSKKKSSVAVEVVTESEDKYIRIQYTQTNRFTGERREFDYKIPLITTSCYFGGVRYWFECNLYKNGVYCGRRVGVLYKDGDWFGCRHCYNLTYESRNYSGIYKEIGVFMSEDDLLLMRREIKRTSYKGKPTKRYLRYLKAYYRSEYSFKAGINLIEERSKRAVDTRKYKK